MRKSYSLKKKTSFDRQDKDIDNSIQINDLLNQLLSLVRCTFREYLSTYPDLIEIEI